MSDVDERPGPPAAPGTTGAPAGVLVGRERELGLLRAGLDDALSGRGRLFLVSGEPGIGKSRLADELGAIARQRGARVLWGRCWEAGGAPAYWPWVQSIRSYVHDTDEAVLRAQLGTGASDVAQVVPELGPLFEDLPPSPVGDSDAARFRLFDAVTAFLASAARHRPIVLVLEDLQAADAPSLLLLQFLAGALAETPMLVIATYRDVEVDREHPLAFALPELVRHRVTRRIELAGLTVDEVAPFVESVTGIRPSAAVAAAVHRETDGNPLFVTEVTTLAAAEGRLDEADPAYWERAVPRGVREVIGLRVGRLSPACVEALRLASVLGRELTMQALEQMSGLAVEDVEAAVDEAVVERVVEEVPGLPDGIRFAHALIRDTLYEELPPSRRSRLHIRAGEALQALYGTDPDAHAAELAHHFFLAGPRAGVDRVVASARRAGDRALALLAYEEAVRFYGMALTATSWGDRPDPGTTCDLHLVLGDAWSRAGDLIEAKRSYLRAAELARDLDRPRSLARAALGFGGRFVWPRAATDPLMLPLLEQALAALADDQGELRVRVMARLAAAKRDEPDRAPREEMSRRTVELARALGDPGALAYALAGRHAAMLGPAHGKPDGEHPEELIRVAEAAGDAELVFEGHLHTILWLLERGDVSGAMRALDRLEEIAQTLHQPGHQWLVMAVRATFALLRGPLPEAEILIPQADRMGERAQDWDAHVFASIQMFFLRREQGQLEGMWEAMEEALATYPTRPLFSCMQAALSLELGDRGRAAAILAWLARDRFAPIAVNNDWALSTTLLAEVVHGLGDAALASELHALLMPAARSCVETLEVSTGAVARALGLLAATMGRLDDAATHLDAALALNERTGARPWAAHTRRALAEVLLARDALGDRERAVDHLRRALETTHETGQLALTERITTMLDELEPAAEATPGPPPGPGPRARRGVLRREGEYWLVALDGRESHLHDAKGLRHLAVLIASPGREFHALDLVGALGGRAGRARAPSHDDGLSPSSAAGTGEVLDGRARASYRRRIEELQSEIDEAGDWNDAERAARAQAELDFLLRELAAATGLGGRARPVGSDAERARVNVTRAIRSSIARIAAHDPELGDHLERSVQTGIFCRYVPDPAAPVTWTS